MIFKKKKGNKIGTSTGFEPMGSALTLQIFLYYSATIQLSCNNFVGMKLSEWPCQFFFLMLLAMFTLTRVAFWADFKSYPLCVNTYTICDSPL